MSKYEWDENKNKSNIKKHGIDFEYAKAIFDDKNNEIIPSDQNKENRWKAIGKISKWLFSVIFTIRKQVIRIISARKANKQERQIYLKKRNNEKKN